VDVLALSEVKRSALRAKLRQRAIALDEALGRGATWDEAVGALVDGLAETLDVVLELGDLSPFELSLANQLQRRYAGDEWTFSR
jgi:lipoate-protein ligase A